MMMQVSDLIPGMPPLPILTVIAMSIVMSNALLYFLSRINLFLYISSVSLIYAAVPVMALLIASVKHL